MHNDRLTAAASIVVILAACDRAPEPSPTQKGPVPAASTAAIAPTGLPTVAPQELVWTAPTAWEKAPTPGPMRKATYRIKGAAGDERGAEVSVSQAGGTVNDNVKRWAGQMIGSDKTLKQHEKKVGPYAVTVVEMVGEYQSGMPGSPTITAIPDSTFVGAIIELDNGQSLFFKMVGSTKTVTAARADFDAMIDSVH